MNTDVARFRTAKIRTGTTLLLCGYWLALFVATHVPRVPIQFASPNADKWEHLAAYGLLAVLLAARQSLWQALNWKSFGRIAVCVALYGVFDELTQIPVGRHADVADWFADILGSVSGLAVFATMRAVFRPIQLAFGVTCTRVVVLSHCLMASFMPHD